MKKIKKADGRILAQYLDDEGYIVCRLTLENGIREIRRVHELVAQAFCENPNNYKNIRFKDGNKLNVAATNLEWY